VRQPIEAGQNIFCGTEDLADCSVLQNANRPDDQRSKAEHPRHFLPDRSENGGTLCRDDNTTVGLIAVRNRTNNIGLWSWYPITDGTEPSRRGSNIAIESDTA
jgi:hypothetical protein